MLIHGNSHLPKYYLYYLQQRVVDISSVPTMPSSDGQGVPVKKGNENCNRDTYADVSKCRRKEGRTPTFQKDTSPYSIEGHENSLQHSM